MLPVVNNNLSGSGTIRISCSFDPVFNLYWFGFIFVVFTLMSKLVSPLTLNLIFSENVSLIFF